MATCPDCDAKMFEIDCEKTIICEDCGKEWKYNEYHKLVEVEEDDDIYLDR